MTKQRGLGKGLGAIFQDKALAHRGDPTATAEDASGTRVEVLPVARIQPNPYQPRKEFNPEELAELAASIREKGVFQPILVRAQDGQYQIIAGERRFRASQLAGKDTIPALVREQVTDREMREVALLENIQRVQLNPVEEAEAYQELINDCGYTHDQLSERLGKSRPAISNSLRLLKLPPEVRTRVVDGSLTAGHAKILAALPDDRQRALARQVAEEHLSVRALEALAGSDQPARKKTAPTPKASAPRDADPNLTAFLRSLEERLGTRVALDEGSDGKGQLRIQYLSGTDLNRISDIILGTELPG